MLNFLENAKRYLREFVEIGFLALLAIILIVLLVLMGSQISTFFSQTVSAFKK